MCTVYCTTIKSSIFFFLFLVHLVFFIFVHFISFHIFSSSFVCSSIQFNSFYTYTNAWNSCCCWLVCHRLHYMAPFIDPKYTLSSKGWRFSMEWVSQSVSLIYTWIFWFTLSMAFHFILINSFCLSVSLAFLASIHSTLFLYLLLLYYIYFFAGCSIREFLLWTFSFTLISCFRTILFTAIVSQIQNVAVTHDGI